MNHSKIIVLLLISYNIAIAQWTQMTVNNNYFFRTTFFVSDSIGYAVGKNGQTGGIILKTTDGGENWDSTAFNNPIFSIYFPDKDTGYANTYNKIYKTVDGGNNWTALTYNFPGGFNGKGLFFVDSEIGYYGNGDGFTIYKTMDGGSSWTTQNIGANNAVIEAIYFFNQDTGILAGWYGPKIAKTNDGGNNWMDVINQYGVYSLQFPNKTVGYAVGANSSNIPIILKTTDRGNTWNAIHSETFVNAFFFSSIFCLNTNTCYAVGDSGTILKTTDGGNNWLKQNSGGIFKLNSISCTNTHCYAVGDSGVILKTIDGEVQTAIKNIPEKKSEITIYPNPFTTTATIVIPSETRNLTFTLYDVLGQEVFKQQILNPKSQILNPNLSNGIYFYQISDKEKNISRGKLVKQ